VQNGAHEVLFGTVGIGLETASSELVTLMGIVPEPNINSVFPKLHSCNCQVWTKADISTLKLVTGQLQHITEIKLKHALQNVAVKKCVMRGRKGWNEGVKLQQCE